MFKNKTEQKMLKKWLRSKLYKFLQAEEYIKDDFDKQHLGFVYLGITSIEDHEKIKKYYFEHKIHKINLEV